jgi:hypothetical protein
VFDFVSRSIDPGENWQDNHHYGVQVYNGSEEWGKVRIVVGAASFELRMSPRQVVTLNDEESQTVNVINTGTCRLQVEWKKTRD